MATAKKCTQKDSSTAVASKKASRRRTRRKAASKPAPESDDRVALAIERGDPTAMAVEFVDSPGDVSVEAEQIQLDATEAERDVVEQTQVVAGLIGDEDAAVAEPTPAVEPERVAQAIGAGVTVFRERKTAPCTRFLLKELLD